MLPDWALPLASLPRAALIEYSAINKGGHLGILCTFRFSLYSECNCGLQLIIYMYIYSIYGIYKFLFSTFAFAHSILIINGSSRALSFCFCSSINNSFVIGIKNNKHTNIFYGCNCCKTLWIALSKLNVSVCIVCVCVCLSSIKGARH